MTQVLFFLAAIGAITGAIAVVMVRNPFYSVLALVGHLISLAALFLLLRAEFVAAAQVVVYAGAVMVLYVFVVAYVGRPDEPLHSPGGALKVLGPLFGLALAVELCIAMLGSTLKGISGKGAPYIPGFGTPAPDRAAVLDHLPVPVRARLAAAAGGGDRRRRAGAPPSARPAGRGRGQPPVPARPARRSRARWPRPPGCAPAPAPTPRPTSRQSRSAVAGASARPRRGGLVMAIGWYLAVSAMIFCIGAVGVLVRPNPLVILLCLELMLNAANLALVAFSRMWGGQDGQVFALIVLVVAACEVTVGLGLIVAIYRRQMAVNVDELNELRG